ncbi:4'-phosphopantetheinyl transferase [Naumannella halotolerans]|uniref:4'-phosphopantetheinyl transferase n=2 Tax=Naumannella halotolerans TaxID=993414 RepID=A0A4R7J124_9ACTN|nr:4'-phosphopantetheinyl transferase [Naumannella halotolerans]
MVDSRRCDIDEQLRRLSPHERSTCDKIGNQTHRRGWICAHSQLRQLIAAMIGCAPSEVQFGRRPCPVCGGEGGRPVLATDEAHRIHFSISHSDWLVAIAVADRPVGIDVQVLRQNTYSLLNELSPVEQRQIGTSASRMNRCWARKEAVLKAAGIGIAHGLRAPHVGGADQPHQPPGFEISDLDVPRGFHGAVAVAARPTTKGQQHDGY